MKTQRFCITFAGVIGSGKTPIAHYLSCNLGLPIFSNDAIRSEVKGDRLHLDQSEFEKRRNSRQRALVKSGLSFIYDASVDRRWPEFKKLLTEASYDYFIISLDLSRPLIKKIHKAKECNEYHRFNLLLKQHEYFLAKYGGDVGLSITDKEFPDRLTKSLAAVKRWLKKRG